MLKRLAGAATLAALVLSVALPARADDTIRVGNAAPASLFFDALYIGISTGIFKKHGLDVQPIDIFGPAKAQEAMAAGSIDFELGSGTELVYPAKGAKELAIATIVEPPAVVDVIVKKDGPIKTLADLKGKTIAIVSVGSLTEWLAKQIAVSQGWGPDGVKVQAVGSAPAEVAMLMTGQVDASIVDTSAAHLLEQKGQGRILISCAKLAKNFITHAIYASKDIIDTKPDVVRRFLAGWFETEEYMLTHKAETVPVIAQKLQVPTDIASQDYDDLIGDFSRTGRFPPAALKVLAASFVQMGVLSSEPNMTALYTEKFLPPPIK
jgi:NitT/TauT family transport system substrate-binding protein